MRAHNLYVMTGLPFAKELVMTLPTGRSWWTDINDFDVFCQLREGKDRESILVLDLTQYLIVTMPTADVVNIKLEMTGADTNTLVRGGFYDILISDTGTLDARAYQLLQGRIIRETMVTADEVSVL